MNKITNKDALNALKAFADQSEKNIAFGVLADTENGTFSTFIKGKDDELTALIVMKMAEHDAFKKLLFKAVAIYKHEPYIP